MATTVQNPFDTQQASATGNGIVGSAIQSGSPPPAPSVASETTAPASNISSGPSPAANTTAMYAPTTRDIDQQTGTVQGQVNSILATDSPLMQRARTLATQQMAGRGLVNSSMNAGAGVAAMTDKAMAMGAQDANAYNQAASENVAAKNVSGQFNAGALNTASLQTGQQKFTAEQTALDRSQQTNLQVGQQKFTAEQNKAQQDFTAAQTNLDRAQQVALADKSNAAQLNLQKAQQDFTSAQTVLDRAQQTKLQDDQQEAVAKQQVLDNQAKLDQLGLQIDANKATIPSTFASSITNTAMTGVNAIMADGAMNAAAKQTAISNLVTYANSQISWAEKFYGTTIPKITTPTVK
jgi:hypothetical protein